MGSQRLIIILTVSSGVLLNGFLWLLAIFFFERGQEAVILHYRTDIGIDFVGESRRITTLPLVGGILLIFNLVLGASLWRTDRSVAWLLWGVIPVLQLFLLVAFYFLWRVNN